MNSVRELQMAIYSFSKISHSSVEQSKNTKSMVLLHFKCQANVDSPFVESSVTFSFFASRLFYIIKKKFLGGLRFSCSMSNVLARCDNFTIPLPHHTPIKVAGATFLYYKTCTGECMRFPRQL